MAGRRTNSQPNLEHTCVQERCLGEIVARLDSQEEADNRFEKSITLFVTEQKNESERAHKRYEEFTAGLTKISTILETTTQANARLAENQSAMMEKLDSVVRATEQLKTAQEHTKTVVEEHIRTSDDWKLAMDQRVISLERTKYFWYTLGGICAALLAALSYLATIYASIKDDFDQHVDAVTISKSVNDTSSKSANTEK